MTDKHPEKQVCGTCGGSGQSNQVVGHRYDLNGVHTHFGVCDTCHGTGVAPDKQQSELSEVKNKDNLPHDELYQALRPLRGTPDHLWLGSDEERTRHAYNKVVALIRRERAEAVREFSERVKGQIGLFPQKTTVLSIIDAEAARWAQ